MYLLPLLPGYGPNANIRSSVPVQTDEGKSILAQLSEAEEMGYQGSYFTQTQDSSNDDGYMTSSSPNDIRQLTQPSPSESMFSPTSFLSSSPETIRQKAPTPSPRVERQRQRTIPEQENAEAVFFEYGVVVFFGLTENQEKSILEDVENAGILRRKINEEHWEVEECHFAVCFQLAC